VQQGRLRCRIPGQREHHLHEPGLCLMAHEREHTVQVAYDCATPLRYAIVQLGQDVLEQEPHLLPSVLRPQPDGAPRLTSGPAHHGLQALAAQIVTCPLDDDMRRFYLSGKALELIAAGMQLVRGAAPAQRITASDVERIHAARDILCGQPQQPPSLDVLAAQVGINTRKLTDGFRRVFGKSAFTLLAEHRLHEAHRMLRDTDFSIAAIADEVGYSPAHFSLAFRKRYGLSPRMLRTGHR